MPVSLDANLLSLSTLRTLFSCFANGTLLKDGEISQNFSFLVQSLDKLRLNWKFISYTRSWRSWTSPFNMNIQVNFFVNVLQKVYISAITGMLWGFLQHFNHF